MNAQEKKAWYVVSVIAASLVVYAVLYATIGSPVVAQAAFGLTALLAAQGLIDRKERQRGRIAVDERDQQIHTASLMAAYAIFWLFFVAAAMVPPYLLGAKSVIKTTDLSLIVFPALCLVELTRSLVLIALYRRGRHA